MTEGLLEPARLTFHVDEYLEATGTGPARRVQRAGRAGNEVLADRARLEKDTTVKLLATLAKLKAALQRRMGGTDFQQFTVKALAADVDQMINQATTDLGHQAAKDYQAAGDLGVNAADQPARAAGLTIQPGLPGLDQHLVTSAFGNTVDLLTPPMQQFATNVKVALRGVALAGDQKFAAIAKLRDQIQGAGFDGAAYKAERIIRTELGRTFNAATYDRMVALSKEFPFMKKGWRATKDNRTRLGHVQAGAKYARGQGSIPIAQSFAVNVYDERAGKAPALIGVCLLRFPVDPQAVPAGRVAAGCTIMCRCNGFVDFDLAAYSAHVGKRVAQLVPGVPSGGVPPAPAGAAPAPKLQVKPARPAKVPGEPRTPKPKDVVPKPATKAGPAGGAAVSGAVDVSGYKVRMAKDRLSEAHARKVRAALAEIDKVHGVTAGLLPEIPVTKVERRNAAKGVQAYYAQSMRDGTPNRFGYGANVMAHQPFMATFHETGHFLDHVGLNGANGADMASETADLMAPWRNAVKNSKAMQSLARWKDAIGKTSDPAFADVPSGINPRMVDYMLSARETWARAYAQYVAVKSENPAALKELRNMQAASTVGPVAPAARTNYNVKRLGQKPNPNSWDYPWAWSAEDFKPIEAAIDAILKGKGWRK